MRKFIIPILFLCFTAFGLEQLVNPFVKFGAGRWTDSTGWNVGNRKSKVNGDLDITGSYKVNGVTIGSGTPITADEEGSEIEDNITGLNFVGNLYTATTSTGTVTLTSTLDTNNIATFYKTAAFTGDVTAASFQASNGVVCDALTVVGGSASSIAGTLTVTDSSGFGNDVTIAGFTRLGELSENIKTKFLKFATTRGSLPGYINVAHGLPGKQLINLQTVVKCDTTGWNLTGAGTGNDLIIPPRSPLSAAFTYDVFYDSIYVSIYLAATATAIRNDTDSAFVWITYRE